MSKQLLQTANNYFLEEKFEQAILEFKKIILKEPQNYVVLSNIGASYQQLNQIQKAKEFYLKALEIKPDYISSLYNLSYIYLLEKDYISGFFYFRYRYTPEIRGNSLGGVAYPPTLLQKNVGIEGITVYISHEQGLGDTIQFIRFLPFIVQGGAKVISYVPPSLIKLFSLNYPEVEFILPNSDISFDYNFPMLESPYLLNMSYEQTPFGNGYLAVNEQDLAKFKQKHNLDNDKKKIAINYRGSQGKNAVKNRSINLESFIKHLNKLDKNIEIYSIQYERTPDEDRLLKENNIINLGAEIKDFYDTSLIIKSMDLVLSSDTSVLHLSGALGKDAIAMLKFSADWRWGIDDKKSIWYDSIDIVRQKTIGDFESIFNEVINMVEAKLL